MVTQAQVNGRGGVFPAGIVSDRPRDDTGAHEVGTERPSRRTTPDYPFTPQLPPQNATKRDTLRQLAKAGVSRIFLSAKDFQAFWRGRRGAS